MLHRTWDSNCCIRDTESQSFSETYTQKCGHQNELLLKHINISNSYVAQDKDKALSLQDLDKESSFHLSHKTSRNLHDIDSWRSWRAERICFLFNRYILYAVTCHG
jgi:hypothetical protein